MVAGLCGPFLCQKHPHQQWTATQQNPEALSGNCWFSHSLLRLFCLPQLPISASQRRRLILPAFSPFLAEPCHEFLTAGLHAIADHAFLLFCLPAYSQLPTFTSFSAHVFQACLYIEQGILHLIIVDYFVKISRGASKGISHTTLALMSLS